MPAAAATATAAAATATATAAGSPAATGNTTKLATGSGLRGAFYLRDFVGVELAARLTAAVKEVNSGELSRGVTKDHGLPGGVVGRGPRLRVWPRSEINGGGLPAAVTELERMLRAAGALPEAQRLLQVTANRYEGPGGSATIVPHKDGRGERAAIVTLEGGATMQFYHRPCFGFVLETEVFDIDSGAAAGASMLLRPRSCLVLSGEAFTEWAHGIAPSPADVADHSLDNFAQLEAEDGQIFPRTAGRISIVFWVDNPVMDY